MVVVWLFIETNNIVRKCPNGVLRIRLVHSKKTKRITDWIIKQLFHAISGQQLNLSPPRFYGLSHALIHTAYSLRQQCIRQLTASPSGAKLSIVA